MSHLLMDAYRPDDITIVVHVSMHNTKMRRGMPHNTMVVTYF